MCNSHSGFDTCDTQYFLIKPLTMICGNSACLVFQTFLRFKGKRFRDPANFQETNHLEERTGFCSPASVASLLLLWSRWEISRRAFCRFCFPILLLSPVCFGANRGKGKRESTSAQEHQRASGEGTEGE